MAAAAPGRASMTKGWPSSVDSAAPSWREIRSVAEPAWKGTTMRTGCCGQSVAWAPAWAAKAIAAAPASVRMRRNFMGSP
ncbi:hypothetical protein D3C86_1479330 [compost metagenome]